MNLSDGWAKGKLGNWAIYTDSQTLTEVTRTWKLPSPWRSSQEPTFSYSCRNTENLLKSRNHATYFDSKRDSDWPVKSSMMGKELVKRKKPLAIQMISFTWILMWSSNKHLANEACRNKVVSFIKMLQQMLRTHNFLYICLYFQISPEIKIICITVSFIRYIKVCRNRKIWTMDWKVYIFLMRLNLWKFVFTIV